MNAEDERGDRLQLFVEAIAAAALAAGGDRLGGAGGAAIAAALGPYVPDLAGKVLAEFGHDARRRGNEMMTSAGDTVGCGPEELANLALRTEQARLLTAAAAFGAMGTTWPGRVRALGRVLADGLIAEDDAKVDTVNMALAAMTEMERPHVSLLELLACHVPVWADECWTSERYKPDANVIGPFGDPRSWPAQAIFSIRPPLGPVFSSLIETLLRHGLVYETDRLSEALNRHSRSIVAYLGRSAQRSQRERSLLPDSPGIPDAPSRWVPTELGEQVLDYYRQAATAPDIS